MPSASTALESSTTLCRPRFNPSRNPLPAAESGQSKGEEASWFVWEPSDMGPGIRQAQLSNDGQHVYDKLCKSGAI